MTEMDQINIRPSIEAQLGSLLLANIELKEKLAAALAEVERLQIELQKAKPNA